MLRLHSIGAVGVREECIKSATPERVGCQKSDLQAAGSYSWISPPSRSRRRNPPKIGPLLGSTTTGATGGM